MGDGGGDFGAAGQAESFLDIVREGRSFSGREPHCSYINMGNGGFADVSAISGFGFADDGRAAGLVDWDHDGDLDVWISNRNGPQVRCLINESPSDHHFVSLRLQGTRSNRDAIGARVDLYLGPGSERPITRTVRAGDGFIAQSSKVLHFGLGDASQVDRVEIHWPSGTHEKVQIPQVDAHFMIVEGTSQASNREFVSRSIPSATSSDDGRLVDRIESNPEESRTLCFSMIRLPVSEFVDNSGNRNQIVSGNAKRTLFNVWASWCKPCVEELKEFADGHHDLMELGIDVVAISVDHLTGNDLNGDDLNTGVNTSMETLNRIKFPFRAGRADSAMLEKLQMLHDTIFQVRNPLPIPTSFLLDRDGRVVAIYKGRVTIDELREDVAKQAASTTEAWRSATLPFAGRWQMPPRKRHLFDYVNQLADAGYIAECEMYVEHNEKMLTTHPSWPTLLKKLQNARR